MPEETERNNLESGWKWNERDKDYIELRSYPKGIQWKNRMKNFPRQAQLHIEIYPKSGSMSRASEE